MKNLIVIAAMIIAVLVNACSKSEPEPNKSTGTGNTGSSSVYSLNITATVPGNSVPTPNGNTRDVNAKIAESVIKNKYAAGHKTSELTLTTWSKVRYGQYYLCDGALYFNYVVDVLNNASSAPDVSDYFTLCQLNGGFPSGNKLPIANFPNPYTVKLSASGIEFTQYKSVSYIVNSSLLNDPNVFVFRNIDENLQEVYYICSVFMMPVNSFNHNITPVPAINVILIH
jgi:hypothetical protein